MKKGPQTKEEHLACFLETKKKIRADLRALPFPEKIKRIIEMQKLARELNKDPNRKIYVWNWDFDD